MHPNSKLPNSADPDMTLTLAADLAPGASVPADTVDGTRGGTTPPSPPSGTPPAPVGAPAIPGYKIVAELAKGGMGRVYAGHDLVLDREVALKTLLPGANAERFVTEAKITARLPHPGIPPVYALGTLDDGAPWLAMKRIRGQTLAALLAARPSPKDDLARFVQTFEQIAQAVGFAHSRGVIHRDLKPLNVMVGEFGEVQVMDWGLAKDTTSPASPASPGRKSEELGESGEFNLADNPQHTAAGSVMGTPGYMAPEQARGEVVDARADVFALGSLLAAILTGWPAFVGTTARETIARAASADLAEALARLASCGAEADLLAVAYRCLGARPADRPADARSVAAEVAAYRAGVEARLQRAETEAAEALVREGEQRKRRRVVQWAGGIIAAVLLVGIAGTGWGMYEADKARRAEQLRANSEAEAKRDAHEKRQLAEIAADKERQATALTGERLKQIELINNSVFDIFAGFDIRKVKAGPNPVEYVLAQRLIEAGKKLDAKAIHDPLVLANLQDRLGQTLLSLGHAPESIEFLTSARKIRQARLGADHPDTLASMGNLALGYQAAGKLGQALPLYEETLQLLKAKLGADHPDTLASMNNLAEGYVAAGKLDLALSLHEETLKLMKAELGADHPSTLNSMNNLAAGYQDVGKLDLALPLLEETVQLKRAKLGADHPDTLSSMNNMADGYRAAGKLDLALPLLEETQRLTKARLGADHPQTLTSMSNLALGYQDAGKLDLALPLFEETQRLTKARLGADHPHTLISMAGLASAYQEARKLDLALPLYEETLMIRKAKLGPDHPDTLTSMNSLALAYQDSGKLDLALPLLEETLRLMKAKLGATHPHTFRCMNNLAMGYRAAGKLDLALPLLEETLTLRKANLGADHPDTLTSMGNLGIAYCDAKLGAKGAPLLKEFVAALRKRFPPDDPGFAGVLAQVSLALLGCEQFAAAEELLRECLAIREKTQPDAWTKFNTQSLLGGALLGQQKHAEAEPPLLAGYEGLTQREKSIPPQASARLPEAVERLIELYTATNKPDEVKWWQTERAKYPESPATPTEKK